MQDHANPYAPPVTSEAPSASGAPSGRASSKVPLVCGILSIIFSALMVFVGISGVAYALLHARAERAAAARYPASQPAERPALGLGGASDLAALAMGIGLLGLTPALLVVGVGQLRYRRWSWLGTLIWAGLALLCLLLPLLTALVQQADSRETLGHLFALVLLGAYPVVLVSLFMRGRVRRALGR